MTALAMIIGMLPMSLGLGEGGEQNAPLGRAVIGGLVVATVATLFFVPVVFSFMHRRATVQHAKRMIRPPPPRLRHQIPIYLITMNTPSTVTPPPAAPSNQRRHR